MTMTLGQVRDWHLARHRENIIAGYHLGTTNHKIMADAIDAHMVDVLEVIAELRANVNPLDGYHSPKFHAWADKLEASIKGASHG